MPVQVSMFKGIALAFEELEENDEVNITKRTFGEEFGEIASEIIYILKGLKCDIEVDSSRKNVKITVLQ